MGERGNLCWQMPERGMQWVRYIQYLTRRDYRCWIDLEEMPGI
jgi:hypothetical protein